MSRVSTISHLARSKDKSGATPGTTNYENEQSNGGDLLAAFGIVNLGARLYDPVIGRFLTRDPILQASNPYVFAGNDPVNMSDPTGMFQECIFCASGKWQSEITREISRSTQGKAAGMRSPQERLSQSLCQT